MRDEEKCWEGRYRELEKTLTAMIEFAARQEFSPEVGKPTIFLANGRTILTFPVVSQRNRFAYWIYKGSELIQKVPYSYSTRVDAGRLPERPGYRVCVFVAAERGGDAVLEKWFNFDVGGRSES